ncbi:DNA polymerase IV [Spiroplasma endosymbiont of Amphibalanus improvisus]|uniref:Y-family DNA polymerase n=1 Tax=Spiroplasma endosymbiont of Amphibalanus improvisus TaxID=3066327 RepID=UPI00313BF906
MRVIFHIDMDAYFATCHKAINSQIRSKPVVVVHKNVSSAIITAVCYEARKYKIKVGMSLYHAKNLCPNLIVETAIHSLYVNFSVKIFELLSQKYTSKIVIASIDEFFLDVTTIIGRNRSVKYLAQKIQQDIWNKFQISNSIGISYNPFLAKTATDLKKPMGISIITPQNLSKTINTLPIAKICSVGKVSQEKLKQINIYTVDDFLNFENQKLLIRTLGKNNFNSLILKLTGKSGDQLIYTNNFVKSISKETSDIVNPLEFNELINVIHHLTNDIYLKMKNRRLKTKGISIMFRTEQKKITRQATLDNYSNNYQELLALAINLFNKNWEGDKAIQILGVSFYHLEYEYNTFEQLTIDNYQKNKIISQTDQLINQINKKYKKNVLYKGIDFLESKPLNSIDIQDKFILFKK